MYVHVLLYSTSVPLVSLSVLPSPAGSASSPTATGTTAPPSFFLPIPEIYFYVIVAVASFVVLLIAIALVAICCVCTCKKKHAGHTWQSADANGSRARGVRVQSAGVTMTAHPRLLSAKDAEAKKSEEDFDDPALTLEAESSLSGNYSHSALKEPDGVGGSIPPCAPPSYDELEFLPAATGYHTSDAQTKDA